jgi:hypothetical protein
MSVSVARSTGSNWPAGSRRGLRVAATTALPSVDLLHDPSGQQVMRPKWGRILPGGR